MTWNLPGENKVLSGAMAELFRASLASVYDMMLEETQGMEPWDFKIPSFDRLSWSQRLALLVEVGESLLRSDVPEPELTAMCEAAVAVVARNVDDQLSIEIDGDFAEEGSPRQFYWRRVVRAVLVEAEVPSPHETVLEVTSEELNEWLLVTESYVWGALLWDEDWLDDDTQDADPRTSALVKNQLGIADGYYSAIAPDPRPDEIIPLVRRMDALLVGVSEDDRYFHPGFVPENLGFEP
jgi:hypothetical protein